jgi:dTDP-3-amino-2,3,6-trideoxy-4-keto-D-glucose/dTDP-3-amino-3,4,6-trideoxy-alpha-D-glucose/dTDP-2,6-dideoxy-D-kanosamine transaminase
MLKAKMIIKCWDYKAEYEAEKEEIHSAIEEVLTSGHLILGEKVKQFETDYANFCDVKFGVGVDNGTNAIFLALKALGIGENDEVITVSNTAVPTVSAIVSACARPVFVDIDETSFLMDTTKIESAISFKTKCILPVHLFGQCVDMDEVNMIAKKYELKVLEDCAQSHGAVYHDHKAGSLSDVAATSFYPTKILGTFGDAGMVMTNNEEMYKKLLRLRFYGMEGNYYAIEQGYNCRLDEIHAAVLLKKLNHITDYINKRRYLAERYHELLKDTSLILPAEIPSGKHSYCLYVVRHPKRDLIMEELKKMDIPLNIHYPCPVHLMKGYKYLNYKEGDLPVTEKTGKEIFSLPLYPSMTEDKQLYISDAIHEIMKKLH